MDFFTVMTCKFEILYCLFVIDHKRREILHCSVTPHPNSPWVIQQLRETFPFETQDAFAFLIFDRDTKFSKDVKGFIKRDLKIKPVLTGYKSPWQNGVAERWVKSARSEMLNHLIILNENHLCRIMKEYIAYYNKERCHLALGKDSPQGRETQKRPSGSAKVTRLTTPSGLLHKFVWRKAA